MLEHGRCAKGSSRAFCGATTVGVAMRCLLQYLFLVRWCCGCAALTDCLDAANLKGRTRATRVGNPPDSHLVAHVLCKSFRWKAVRVQIGDRVHGSIVN